MGKLLSCCSCYGDKQERVRSLFLYVKMKSLVQSVRFKVYSIIDSLMARHRDGTVLIYLILHYPLTPPQPSKLWEKTLSAITLLSQKGKKTQGIWSLPSP